MDNPSKSGSSSASAAPSNIQQQFRNAFNPTTDNWGTIKPSGFKSQFGKLRNSNDVNSRNVYKEVCQTDAILTELTKAIDSCKDAISNGGGDADLKDLYNKLIAVVQEYVTAASTPGYGAVDKISDVMFDVVMFQPKP